MSRPTLWRRAAGWIPAVMLGLAAGVLSAMQTPPVDLTGDWLRNDGGVIRMTQQGRIIKMVHIEVAPEIHKEFGFNPGDDHVNATLEGRTVRGSTHVHLPMSWKTICPDQWDHWSRIEVTLSEDGNTLDGLWERGFFNDLTCERIRQEWQPRRYTRVRGAAPGEPGTLSAVAVGAPPALASFELILDSSGSMWGTVGGRPKIEIAKETMRQVVEGLPDGVDAALRVYGHRVAPGSPKACQDSELIFPPAKLDKARFVERIRGLKALGTTPIAYSLSQVAADMGAIQGEKMVILVTDGKEECGGSVSRAVSGLIAKNLDVQLNIVGFALEDEATKRELERAAALGSGRFFDAANASALRDAVERSLSVSYDVFNAAGRKVADGGIGRGGIPMPPGTYTVVIHSAGVPTTIRDVRIASGKLTTIEVTERDRQIQSRVLAP